MQHRLGAAVAAAAALSADVAGASGEVSQQQTANVNPLGPSQSDILVTNNQQQQHFGGMVTSPGGGVHIPLHHQQQQQLMLQQQQLSQQQQALLSPKVEFNLQEPPI